MFGIDRCSVYTGLFNKDFQHWELVYCSVYTGFCYILGFSLYWFQCICFVQKKPILLYPRSPKGEGGILFYLRPSVQDIFHRIFLNNCWWQKSDIWSQASYRYTILWVAFLDPSDSYFLFADLVGFYTHWTYMHIFHHIFLSNYWWQKSDIWSQASYRYPISWEAFFDPSDSYFLFAEERRYHRWALAHSSSCCFLCVTFQSKCSSFLKSQCIMYNQTQCCVRIRHLLHVVLRVEGIYYMYYTSLK